MSLEAIIALNERIAADAAENHLAPFVPDGPEDADSWPPFPFPSLGQVPDGWEAAEHFLVDATGGGRTSEPALTVEQFRTCLRDHITDHPDHGYAITEEGPFQLVVSALRSTRQDLIDRLRS